MKNMAKDAMIVQLTKEFRKAWHHILGSIDMHEDDKLHYRTSKI